MTPGPSGSIVRASAIMGVGTLVSRVTGYARSILLVSAIGLQLHADLFTVANTIPNALYILAVGGVLNAVLVPQLVRTMREDPDGGQAYANRVFTLVGGGLLLLSVAAVLAAPWLVRLYAPGELYGPELIEQRESLEAFARFCLPQVLFYGLYVLFGQVLNARERFGPMMFAPIANNVLACITLGWYLVVFGPSTGGGAYTSDQELLLGIGSTLGVAAQAAVLVPYLRRSGFRYRPRFDFRGTGLGHTGRLAVWTVLFVVVNQIAFLVVTRVAVESSAAAVQAGSGGGIGATVYQNAFLVLMVPHALVTVSLVTAALPRLSRLAAASDLVAMRRELVSTLRLAVAFAMLAGVLLMVLAPPLARLLFGWGAGAGDTSVLGHTLMAFVPGLIAFTVHFVTLRGFYALEDTRTPFLVQCVVAGTNVVLALALAGAFDAVSSVGLAAAFSFAYVIGATVSTAALGGRLGGLHLTELAIFFVRALLATAPAAVAAIAGLVVGQAVVGPDGSRLQAAVALVLAGGLAAPTYLATARRFGLPEIAQIADLVTSRLPGRGSDARRSAARRSGVGADAPSSMGRAESADEIGVSQVHAEPIESTAEETAAGAGTGVLGIFAYDAEFDEPSTGPLDVTGTPGTTDRSDEPRGIVPSQAAVPGTVLAGRYRLEELLASSSGASTWRGIDEVLSRPVALHLLAIDDPRVDELALAARSAASLPDSHFLRMLDVSVDPADGAGAYAFVVREWVAGRNLGEALGEGPFDADDAVYVTRELAAAMASAHRAGLSHLRLEPDTVVLADNGQVKVVDLAVDRVLRRTSAINPYEEDAKGLGRVLYACLTGRWPGGSVPGLPAAPLQDGKLCSPRQVLAGVPGPLDEVCDRILGDPPRAGRLPLTTPVAIDEALDYVAGRQTRRRSVNLPAAAPPVHADAHAAVDPTAAWRRPDGPPEPLSHPPSGRSPWRTVVGSLVSIILLAGALLLGYELAQQAFGDPTGSDDETTTSTSTTTSQTTSSAPSSGPLTIAEALAYDPAATGGSGDENDDSAGDAIDDDPSTGWTTVNYFDPLEDQDKPGVGLVLDLGEVRTVDAIELQLLAAGGAIELRAAPADASEPPGLPDDWSVVASVDDPSIEETLTLDESVDTRFLLVWFTALPPSGDNFKGGVNEVVVLGR